MMEKSKWKVVLKNGDEHIIESENESGSDQGAGLCFYNKIPDPDRALGYDFHTIAKFAGGSWDYVIKISAAEDGE
jgi:hypothetical protein